MDEQDFRNETLVIQLTCKVSLNLQPFIVTFCVYFLSDALSKPAL